MEYDPQKNAALEILKFSRNKLYFELRFMEQALFRLEPEEHPQISIGSNGKQLFYNTTYLINRFLSCAEDICCDYLHMIIHCLYQHPLLACTQKAGYWDLACDIEAADVIGAMNLPWAMQRMPAECFELIKLIRKKVRLMSAPHIAQYLQAAFTDHKILFGHDYEDLKNLFYRDDHNCWNYKLDENKDKNFNENSKQNKGESKEKNKDTSKDENKDENQKESHRNDGENMQDNKPEQNPSDNTSAPTDRKETHRPEKNPSDNTGAPPDKEEKIRQEQQHGHTQQYLTPRQQRNLANEWKEVAEKVILSVQGFPQMHGKMPGTMIQNLEKLTRESYDYSEFLRKFAVMNERMKINMDEYDYIYYLYGLQTFKKIPLIEPLEYKEEYQIREFAIVIDTSGSCSGELVQRFLTKTYNILKQSEHFSDRVVLHVIQCDAAVQEDMRLDSLEHLEEYMENMELKGFGGTDFRPAFTYVDMLCRKKEFTRLCGLIYFTDGYGIFPEKPPDYKTAFVFVEKDHRVTVPPWAMQLYLEPEIDI